MMNRFWGIVRYEYRMSTRRWSLWVVLGLITAFYFASGVYVDKDAIAAMSTADLWGNAGMLGFQINLFLPVAGGILISDRMWRDRRLGVKEILDSTGMTSWEYVLGKYFGSLLSILTPVLVMNLALSGASAIVGVPPAFIPMMLVSFLAINVPAFAFITIFSLACPLIMPLRVYQVLFTGYWFWGNYLNPDVFPTLAGTLLTASGRFVMEGFFGTHLGEGPFKTSTAAVLNLVVLAGCILLAMIVVERYFAVKARRA